jgi:hypothetical protein
LKFAKAALVASSELWRIWLVAKIGAGFYDLRHERSAGVELLSADLSGWLMCD